MNVICLIIRQYHNKCNYKFKEVFGFAMQTDHSKAVLLLWITYVVSVLFCYAFMHVCLLMPCGHQLGKGRPLGSRLLRLVVTLSLSHWYSG